MVAATRYDVSDEAAGLHHGVLANKSDIQDQATLDFDIHRYFLSPLYAWAGKIRTVDISKNGMMFAPASHIASSLKSFEQDFASLVPQHGQSKRDVAHKLAVIHCELNAIHPFREGNGRTIRLFLDLIAWSAGFSTIDWSKRTQKTYIQACVDGMMQNYSSMERAIAAGLTKN